MKKVNHVLILFYLTVLLLFTACSGTAMHETTTGTVSQTAGEKSSFASEKDLNNSKNKTFSPTLKVHFIDVGQADSAFIELPNGETMLIDAGTESTASKVASYLADKGVTNLDYVIATHPHADHIGGMPSVLSIFPVGTFYMPRKEHTSNTFFSMLEAIHSNGCKAVYAEAGKSIINTGDLKAYFVAPTEDTYPDLNNYSAVLKLEYKNASFLFTGDAEELSELKMLSSNKKKLCADVLKVGHHGSNSSSKNAFLSAVKPKYAVISVGTGNSYGHPTAETLNRLKDAGADIYRTDEVGTITIETDGHAYTIDKTKSVVEPNAPPASAGTAVEDNSGRIADTEWTDSDILVYRTSTGECYHLDGCTSLSKSKIAISINEAQTMGLRPCKRCNPPE